MKLINTLNCIGYLASISNRIEEIIKDDGLEKKDIRALRRYRDIFIDKMIKKYEKISKIRQGGY